MSGHSKWSTIKRKKGAADAKRGKIFTKLIREIATAARLGGAEPDSNPRLRLAIERAREANMPKDNILRAIKKGTGGGEGESYEEVVYEGYGPGGAAVFFEKRGLLSFDREGLDVDALLEAALESGADDVVEGRDAIEVIAGVANFEETKRNLEAAGFHPASAGFSLEPTSTVKLEGEAAESMLRLADALEDLDDVQSVYANFDISEEEMARIAS
jgi:transcriptional/translational regulatory protein YebC/TACO1